MACVRPQLVRISALKRTRVCRIVTRVHCVVCLTEGKNNASVMPVYHVKHSFIVVLMLFFYNCLRWCEAPATLSCDAEECCFRMTQENEMLWRLCQPNNQTWSLLRTVGDTCFSNDDCSDDFKY